MRSIMRVCQKDFRGLGGEGTQVVRADNWFGTRPRIDIRKTPLATPSSRCNPLRIESHPLGFNNYLVAVTMGCRACSLAIEMVC